jgi:hypothetical protein
MFISFIFFVFSEQKVVEGQGLCFHNFQQELLADKEKQAYYEILRFCNETTNTMEHQCSVCATFVKCNAPCLCMN